MSIFHEQELEELLDCPPDIIDVKNPREGSLGANFPRVIKHVRKRAPRHIEVSATIGDLHYLPGTASLAALGAAVCGVNYVKAGLYKIGGLTEALELVKEVKLAIAGFNSSVRLIIAGYADYREIGSINPLVLPEVARKTEADGVMIDVFQKHRGGLFSFMSENELISFVDNSKKYGLISALAGSLGLADVKRVKNIGADVFGVRGAVCRGDRLGSVDKNLVKQLLTACRA